MQIARSLLTYSPDILTYRLSLLEDPLDYIQYPNKAHEYKFSLDSQIWYMFYKSIRERCFWILP